MDNMQPPPPIARLSQVREYLDARQEAQAKPAPGRLPGQLRAQLDSVKEPAGGRVEPGLSRKEFMLKLYQAAWFSRVQSARGKRRAASGPMPATRNNLHHAQAAAKCTAAKENGARCRAAAIRGATRCQSHGGWDQAPTAPATARAYLSGRLRLGRLARFKTHPSCIGIEAEAEARAKERDAAKAKGRGGFRR